MQVLVIGATGATGRRLVDRLVADGHEVRAMIRRSEQADDLEAAGANTVMGDVEGELLPAFEGAESVAFCAGSGAATGADATLRVDLHGAVRCVDLCVELGIRRFVMLSSIAADDPLRGPEKLRHYLAAKHAADRILLASGLDATVVRPGGLTDDEPTGQVRIGVPRLEQRGSIPRGDVAATMAACLRRPDTIGAVFEVVSGETPIERALGEL